MKISLQTMADKIDQDLGPLSPIRKTTEVIKSRFQLAHREGRITAVDPNKKRSWKSWVMLLEKSGTLLKR